MARPLRDTPPTSAVARLLDVGAAARAVSSTAVSAPESTKTPPQPSTPSALETRQHDANTLIKREFVLTPATERALTTLIESIRCATGARVSASHVLRALLLAVEHAQISVRIDPDEYRRLKAHFLEMACRRSLAALEAEFARIEAQPYAPVRVQLLSVWRATNRARRVAGLDAMPVEAVPWQRRIVRPFE